MATENRVTQQNTTGQPEGYSSELYLPDVIYWPFNRLPESKFETYAIACVETALKYSEEARTVYAEFIRLWSLSGCQAFLNDAGLHKQDTKDWLRDRLRAAVVNKPPPDWPVAWKEAIAKVKEDTDFHKLLEYVFYFIRAAFNRKADIENRTLKVLPGKAPYLAQAVFMRSINDYLKVKPELKQNWPKVVSDNELTNMTLLYHILGSAPTTRMSRQVKRQIVRTLRKKDFTLHHYQTIVDGAEMWYRARVLCDTAREAADYYHIDAIDLSKRIEPYDDATGWPRHR